MYTFDLKSYKQSHLKIFAGCWTTPFTPRFTCFNFRVKNSPHNQVTPLTIREKTASYVIPNKSKLYFWMSISNVLTVLKLIIPTQFSSQSSCDVDNQIKSSDRKSSYVRRRQTRFSNDSKSLADVGTQCCRLH